MKEIEHVSKRQNVYICFNILSLCLNFQSFQRKVRFSGFFPQGLWYLYALRPIYMDIQQFSIVLRSTHYLQAQEERNSRNSLAIIFSIHGFVPFLLQLPWNMNILSYKGLICK